MPQFHETRYGKIFLEGQLPKLIKSLELIGQELKRSNDIKEGVTKRDTLKQKEVVKHDSLKQIADEMQSYDHNISQVLDMYRKDI